MGLNYNLGDKSENLRRMNYFKKLNKAKRDFFWQKMLNFSCIMYFGLKIEDNLIWDALYMPNFLRFGSKKSRNMCSIKKT